MQYRGAIFDLDGTLIDSEAIARKAMADLFRDAGSPLKDTEIASMLGRSSRDLIPLFLKNRGMISASPNIVQDFLGRYRERHGVLWKKNVALMAHADEVLRDLKGRGIPMGLATTSRGEIVDLFLDKFDYRGMFRCVISADVISRLKPDPEIYLLALKQLALPRELVLAIEDTPVGSASAGAAGLACAVVRSTHATPVSFPGARYIFSSLAEIVPLF